MICLLLSYEEKLLFEKYYDGLELLVTQVEFVYWNTYTPLIEIMYFFHRTCGFKCPLAKLV